MIITFFILAAGVLNLILGTFIIFSAEKRDGILPLAFFSFATFSVACSDFFIYKLQWPIFDRLSFAFGSLIPIFLLSWIYCYTYKNVKKWILSLIYFAGAIFFFLAMASNLVIYDIRVSETVGLQEKQGILFPFYFAIFLLAYVVVLFSLILMLRTNDEMKKKQVSVILVGFSIYGASGIIFGLLLPTMGYDKFIDFDIIASFIFIGFTSYAVTRYKWMNIKIITVQLLSLSVVGISFFEIFFAGTLSQKIYKIAYFLVLTVVSVFLIKNSKEEVERKDQLQMMADRLSRANDQLRKLDNAKTEFISIASHQLRTPTTAIKGFTSLILEGTYGEIRSEVKGALEKVYASTEQLIQLIEELLNVTRIESERMAFMFEKESLEKLLKELYDNFLLISKTKKFYFELKLPEKPLPKIVMDYSKIRELVSNFIDNALKYTEKGGVTVKAEIMENGVVIDENGFVIFGKKSEFGKVIRITVSDTGIGIPKDEIPYLFKKFSRGKDVSRLHVGGTGLGLYVGKAIAEAHHGQVWVESDGTGKGSRFIIELPIKNKLG